MSYPLPEGVAARVVLHLAVTIIDHHHRRARVCGHAVVQAVRELGPDARRPDWAALVAAYDALAAALGPHMHEEEEVLLDRIQLLWAQRRLVFGSLQRALPILDILEAEHAQQLRLAAALDDQLASIGGLEAESPAAKKAIDAIADFARAFRSHVRLEDEALVPMLAPFLAAPD